MATKILQGTLLDAAGAPLGFATIRFVATSTRSIVNSITTDFSVSGAGAYNISLAHGVYTVQIKRVEEVSFRTVCANAYIASSGISTLEAIIKEQSLIQEADDTVIARMLQILSQTTAQANTATAAASSVEGAATAASSAAQTATVKAQESKDAATAAQAAATTSATNATAAQNAVSTVNTAAVTATNAASSASSKALEASNSALSASASATNAATSATAASTASTAASTSATNAATAATAASTSATNASNQAAAAATSATNASNQAAAAAEVASAADTSATLASTKADAASASATLASSKADAASTSATNAAASATNASTSATNAATSATLASSKADAAATQATEAADSAQASNASAASAVAAKDYVSEQTVLATNAATSASASATLASSKADAASASATSADASAILAANKADTATSKALDASNSAIAAAGSSTTATQAATDAATSATSVGNQAATAAAAAASAVAAKDFVSEQTVLATNAAASASASATLASSKADAASMSATSADASAILAADKASAASASASSAAITVTQAENKAAEANQSALNAAASASEAALSATLASGALIEAGSTDLSLGVYPTPIKDSLGNNRSCFWKVVVAGTVGTENYGVGDSLVYSRELSGYYKLDNTEAVSSVNGKQGIVVLTANDLNLGQVDNTSDLNKPISTATANALSSKAPISHIGSVGEGHHGLASQAIAGFMSPTDKIKLDNISGVSGVSSVNSKTGEVVLTKADVGLGLVNNTADLDKPISTATQAALASKYSPTNKPSPADIGAASSFDLSTAIAGRVPIAGRSDWSSQGVIGCTVGMLAWKNYGDGHTIFDASAGTSPDGTAVDKNNAQIAWAADGANYPTLMGWNGSATYGVRVDSARVADSATTADRITGIVSTNWQDLKIHGKRAMVGDNGADQLIINYGNDWGSTKINGNIFTGHLQSERLWAVKNGSTFYGDSQIEARSTDGSDVRIGMHRAGYTAGAIVHNSWGFTFEREEINSRGNVAAANFFADAPQDTTGNALTRKDYVDSKFASIAASDVGLGLVNNTADLDKPISTATQTALGTKYSPTNKPTAADIGAAASSHVGAIGDAHGVATQAAAGFMSSADKLKLDNLGSGGAADSANKLTTSRLINGTLFDGTSDISTANWGASRTITIGDRSKVVDGSSNVSWSIAELGCLPITGGTLSGSIKVPYGVYVHKDGYPLNFCSLQVYDNVATIMSNSNLTPGFRVTTNDTTYFLVDPVGELYARGIYRVYHTNNKPTATDVGLGNVNNTSDLNKPISTATQAALNSKEATIALGTTTQYWRGDKSWQSLDKAAVGLGNVDNTSDLNKPISTATQTALDSKYSSTNKPTAADIGALASSGTAVAATKLATARTIAGKSFDGTDNISITASDVGALPASGGTLSGNLNVNADIKLTNPSSMGILNSFGRSIARGSTVATNVFGNTTDDMYFDGKSLKSWQVRYSGTLYEIYHKGNKPTPAEIGAQPATSDSRVKSDIASLSPVLDKIMLIDPKTFTMEGREGTCVGTIAQDWEVDFPEVILNVPSTAQGEPEMLKGIDALGTIGILLKAIQELKGEIEALKNR